MKTPESPLQRSEIEIPQEILSHRLMYQISGQDFPTDQSLKRYLQDKTQDEVIRGLDPADISHECVSYEVKHAGVGYEIKNAPKADRAGLIRAYFANPNPDVQMAAAWRIHDAQEEQRTDLIRACLANPNSEIQKVAVWMIRFAPKTERPQLFLYAKDQLGDQLVESALYRDTTLIDGKKLFQRKDFQKDGSETTLLGGSLKGKIIIRHIKPKAFLAWQKLFEDFRSWKEAGFDYVPVEPIVSFRPGRDGYVDVYSSVLDLDLESWKSMTGQFVDELMNDKKRILDILDKQKIKHGHPHDANFCLRFFRDSKGHVDFTRQPRLYLIDFDQSISP